MDPPDVLNVVCVHVYACVYNVCVYACVFLKCKCLHVFQGIWIACYSVCHHTHYPKGTIPFMYLSTLLQESSDVIISGLRRELSSLNQKPEEVTSYHQVTL